MKAQGKESQMHPVLCGIDESGSREAVRAAFDYCRKNRGNLKLVGVSSTSSATPRAERRGERVRRSKTVRLELDRAAEKARAAGVTVSTTLRAGNPVAELLREAAATGSGEVFYVSSRGLIRAALTRQPWRELRHISATTPTNRQLAAAA